MPMPKSLVGILVMIIMVGYIVDYAYFPEKSNDIRNFQHDIANSLKNASSSSNPIYALIGIGSASLSTFALAYNSLESFIGVYIQELPADYYIIAIIFSMGLAFGILRYIRGMWDR